MVEWEVEEGRGKVKNFPCEINSRPAIRHIKSHDTRKLKEQTETDIFHS